MSKTATVEHVRHQKLGKVPVVVLPLEDYERIIEDLEMYRSKAFVMSIKRAREDVRRGRVYSLAEVKRRLKIR